MFTVAAENIDAADDLTDVLIEKLKRYHSHEEEQGLIMIEGWSITPSDHPEIKRGIEA